MEVLTYNQYKKKNDVFKLVLTAFLEPFIFHPFIIWSAIKGNIDYIRKKKAWGEMTRLGLGSGGVATNTTVINQLENEAAPPKQSRALLAVKEAAVYSIILLFSMLIIKIYEFIRDVQQFGVPKQFSKVIEFGVVNDISFVLNILIFPVAVFIFLYLLNKKTARFFFITFSFILIIIHAALAEYFLETLVPLGADLWGYSIADVKQTVGAAGISITFICSAIILLGLIIMAFIKIPKRIQLNVKVSLTLLGLFIISAIFSIAAIT